VVGDGDVLYQIGRFGKGSNKRNFAKTVGKRKSKLPQSLNQLKILVSILGKVIDPLFEAIKTGVNVSRERPNAVQPIYEGDKPPIIKSRQKPGEPVEYGRGYRNNPNQNVHSASSASNSHDLLDNHFNHFWGLPTKESVGAWRVWVAP
jgi:hypothetical protein